MIHLARISNIWMPEDAGEGKLINPRIQLGSLRNFAMFSKAVPTFHSFLDD